MKTIPKIIIALSICSFYSNTYGQVQEKNSIICFVLEKSNDNMGTNIRSFIQQDIESCILKENKYKVIIRDEKFLKYRDLQREYEAEDKGNVNVSTISRIGKDLGVNFVCWAEVDSFNNIYIRLINVETTQLEADANGYVKNKLVIIENTNNFLSNLIPPPVSNNFNFLPFGIHQFANKQTGKGILFAGAEGALLVTGIGYRISANNNLKKHEDLKYEDWKRDRFYDKYESQKKISCYLFAGAIVMIGLNYLDNFNWFRKNNVETGFVPTFDWQGKPLMEMTLKIRF